MMNSFINLIGSNTIITILSVLLVLGAIYLGIKVPEMRKFLVALVVIVIYVFGIYATTYNVDYMTAKGLTLGDITDSLISGTTINSKNENVWEFDSLGFVATEKEFEHSIVVSELTPAPNIDLNTKNYVVYINNDKCQINECGSGYIKSSFMYNFYNKNNELIRTETVNINFDVYNKHTELEISTNNGSEAVKYWKSFLVKNGFVLSIKEDISNKELVVDRVGEITDKENATCNLTFNFNLNGVNLDNDTFVTVRLFDITNSNAYTCTFNSNDSFVFENLPIGSYMLSFSPPAGFFVFVEHDGQYVNRLVFNLTEIDNERIFNVICKQTGTPSGSDTNLN